MLILIRMIKSFSPGRFPETRLLFFGLIKELYNVNILRKASLRP